jgi:hypothetical protein
MEGEGVYYMVDVKWTKIFMFPRAGFRNEVFYFIVGSSFRSYGPSHHNLNGTAIRISGSRFIMFNLQSIYCTRNPIRCDQLRRNFNSAPSTEM